jgi:hypothetical protein
MLLAGSPVVPCFLSAVPPCVPFRPACASSLSSVASAACRARTWPRRRWRTAWRAFPAGPSRRQTCTGWR